MHFSSFIPATLVAMAGLAAAAPTTPELTVSTITDAGVVLAAPISVENSTDTTNSTASLAKRVWVNGLQIVTYCKMVNCTGKEGMSVEMDNKACYNWTEAWKHKVMAMWVTQRHKCHVFEHADCRGKKFTITSEAPVMDFRTKGFEGKASSLKCWKPT